MFFRFDDLTLSQENLSQALVGLGGPRIDSHGLAKMRRRLAEAGPAPFSGE